MHRYDGQEENSILQVHPLIRGRFIHEPFRARVLFRSRLLFIDLFHIVGKLQAEG